MTSANDWRKYVYVEKCGVFFGCLLVLIGKVKNYDALHFSVLVCRRDDDIDRLLYVQIKWNVTGLMMMQH